MTSTIPDRVAAGVAWLDANAPDWLDRIDLDELQMDDCCRCMLGQVFDDYWKSPLLAGDIAKGSSDLPSAVPLGFQSQHVDLNSEAADAEYESLAAEWRRVIAERRTAVPA